MPSLSDKIDAILPQTQCRLCEFEGCKPYADAIADNNINIDRCLPGGIDVLKKIATLTEQDPSPYIPGMEKKAKPLMLAAIREDECIGCTKCIQHCPVDAIMGTSKKMHTVITDECTGCELCIAPCPVDCIDMVTLPDNKTEKQKQLSANHARTRYTNRNKRLSREKHTAKTKRQARSQALQAESKNTSSNRKSLIAEAIARAKAKHSGGAK